MRRVADAGKKIWLGGLDKGCSMVLGIVLTRLNPRYTKFERYIEVPIMRNTL